jgi:hypothetical protein
MMFNLSVLLSLQLLDGPVNSEAGRCVSFDIQQAAPVGSPGGPGLVTPIGFLSTGTLPSDWQDIVLEGFANVLVSEAGSITFLFVTINPVAPGSNATASQFCIQTSSPAIVLNDGQTLSVGATKVGAISGTRDLYGDCSMDFNVTANNQLTVSGDGQSFSFAPDPNPAARHSTHVPWWYAGGGALAYVIATTVASFITQKLASDLAAIGDRSTQRDLPARGKCICGPLILGSPGGRGIRAHGVAGRS